MIHFWLFGVLLSITLPAALHAQFTFITNADNTLTITGYAGVSGDLIIPGTINGLTVISIGDDAFSDGSLNSVTIPSSVTSVGSNAFLGNPMTGVTIGTGVTNIGFQAFGGTLLTNVILPGNVRTIGDAAFADCPSLTAIAVNANNANYSSIAGVLYNKSQTTLIQCPGAESGNFTIPPSVSNIEALAFAGCFDVTAIAIPNGVASIGNDAFAGCSLSSVSIPSRVTSIGTGAFLGISLTEIIVDPGNPAYTGIDGVLFNKSHTALIEYPQGKSGVSYAIPNTVNSIGNTAFAGCSSVGSVMIPNSVSSIGFFAFSQSGLTSVTIPSNVTNIGVGAFLGCTSLTSVCFEGNSPNNNTNDASGFSEDPVTFICYLLGATGWGPTFDGIPTAPCAQCGGSPLLGGLQVTINPPSAVSAGAQWQVDGGQYQNSEATVNNLSVGSHFVKFKSISEWTTPTPQMVSVSNNLTTTANGIYVSALSNT